MNKIITIGREFGSGGIISEIAKRTSLSEQYVKSITDMESKIKRYREKATEQEHLSDKELRQHIMEIDKRRAKYYSFFTDRKCGDKSNYDLCINTAYVDIKVMALGIAKMF